MALPPPAAPGGLCGEQRMLGQKLPDGFTGHLCVRVCAAGCYWLALKSAFSSCPASEALRRPPGGRSLSCCCLLRHNIPLRPHPNLLLDVLGVSLCLVVCCEYKSKELQRRKSQTWVQQQAGGLALRGRHRWRAALRSPFDPLLPSRWFTMDACHEQPSVQSSNFIRCRGTLVALMATASREPGAGESSSPRSLPHCAGRRNP